MSIYRAQVELARDTAQAEDKVVNAFHFVSDDVGSKAQEAADIVAALHNFYNAFDHLLSRELTGAITLKVYDLEEPPERVPVLNQVGGALLPASSALPSQIALLCNLEASFASGQPRARARGRLYIGPVSQIDQDIVGDSAASTTIINAVGNAFSTYLLPPLNNLESGSSIHYQLFSRRTAHDYDNVPYGQPEPAAGWSTAALNSAMRAVVRVKIDNRYAVQRRRRVGSGGTVTQFT